MSVFAERDAGREKRPNPFGSDLALANSSYAAFRGKRLVRVPSGKPATPRMEFVHDSFRALVSNSKFSCVGAKAALQSGSYRVGLYETLGSPEAAAGLARDLFWFVEEQEGLGDEFSTFVASFVEPTAADEAAFERLLWEQLQRLHEEDRRYHRWNPSVSPDPEDPKFAFSFAERAFFVVGLHPASSRFSRRFAWPTLGFENLAKSLKRFGIADDDIPTTFNAFMNVDVLSSGGLEIGPPLSGPGDFVDLRAEMDLVVGVTACSAEKSNNHSFKPIDLEIRG